MNRLTQLVHRIIRHPFGAQTPRGRKVRRTTENPAGKLRLEMLEGRQLLSTVLGGSESADLVAPSDRPTADNGSAARVMDPRGSLANNQAPAVGLITLGGRLQCTGTLITPTHVLTAAHCMKNNNNQFYDPRSLAFNVGGPGGTSMAVRTTFAPRNYAGALFSDAGNDIAVMQLSRSVTWVMPMAISRVAPSVGQSVTIIGFGASGSGFYGETLPGGVKRWGTSTIEGVSQKLAYWRYDQGESNTAHGDSGGPQISCTQTQCYIVSVTSGGGRLYANGFIDGRDNTYGSISYNTRVDAFAGMIDQIVRGTTVRSGRSAARSVADGNADDAFVTSGKKGNVELPAVKQKDKLAKRDALVQTEEHRRTRDERHEEHEEQSRGSAKRQANRLVQAEAIDHLFDSDPTAGCKTDRLASMLV